MVNLTALCRFHHRLVHEGGWTITGTPGGFLTFTSPTGQELILGPPGLRGDVRHRLEVLTFDQVIRAAGRP